jgi:hypothetical protein
MKHRGIDVKPNERFGYTPNADICLYFNEYLAFSKKSIILYVSPSLKLDNKYLLSIIALFFAVAYARVSTLISS